MKRLVLSRFCNAPDEMGTFGRLWFTDAPEKWWFTLERPWANNEPGVSCIPTGNYVLRHGTFMAGGGYPDLEFAEVPGRQNIEIHCANYARELKGCIAPGKGMSVTAWAISESRKALKEILGHIGTDDDLQITIT